MKHSEVLHETFQIPGKSHLITSSSVVYGIAKQYLKTNFSKFCEIEIKTETTYGMYLESIQEQLRFAKDNSDLIWNFSQFMDTILPTDRLALALKSDVILSDISGLRQIENDLAYNARWQRLVSVIYAPELTRQNTESFFNVPTEIRRNAFALPQLLEVEK
jgi:hypothetical protein